MVLEKSRIAQFYANKSVLVTGGTGFVGKVLIEKLLRSCPQIKNVYLLIRPSKDKDYQSRLQDLTRSSLFRRLKHENEGAFKKIIPISGDLTHKSLAITQNDRRLLQQNVNVVLHSGASINFGYKLKRMMNVNFHGTQRLIDLAKEMPQLSSFVYLSSVYAHGDRKPVDEVVYECDYVKDSKKFAQCIELMDDSLAETITPIVIGKKTNNYSFVKALTEQLVLEERKHLAVCIIRPSSVSATWKEPVPGWIDNNNANTGVIESFCKGQLHSLQCDKNMPVDHVPVDMLANLIIASGWITAIDNLSNGAVYNSCSGPQNVLSYGEWKSSVVKAGRKYPSSNIVSYPSVFFLPNKFTADIFNHFFTTIPSLFTFKQLDKKEQGRLKYIKVMQPFFLHEWIFINKNVEALYGKLTEVDKEIFNFNFKNIKWVDYMEQYVLGIRKYFWKEDDSTLESARRYLTRLYVRQRIIQAGIFVIISTTMSLPILINL